MRRYEMVNLGDTGRLHRRPQAVTVSIFAAVYKERPSTGRNDEGSVALVDINVVDAQRLSIGHE